MSVPREHHFCPAFYLGQWCDPSNDDKVIEYSIKHGNLVMKPVGRRATGFQRDLYAFPELPPDQVQFIEQSFFDYADRVASEALQMLLSGDDGWTSETRSAWSRFVIGVHLRHPDAIAELRAAARAMWVGEESQRQYELVRRPNDPLTFAERIGKIHPLPATVELNTIMEFIDNKKICGHINRMVWGVVDLSKSSYTLLTSDRPVSLEKPKDRRGLITMPISPTKLFVAVNDPLMLNQLRGVRPRDTAQWSNRLTVERARRYVWAQDSSQQAFIGRHMGTKLDPLPLFPNLDKYPALVPR
jgi:hypothetical protein